MEEQECFPEKNRDEDLLEKILEEENRRILYQAIRRLEVKETRSDSDAVFRWDVSERNRGSATYHAGECACTGI